MDHGEPRFKLGKQSSLAPDRERDPLTDYDNGALTEIDPRVRLMYAANEGDLDGIKEIIDSGTDVNFSDIDGRTALHVATCQGYADVVEFLLQKGAKVDPKDRWGSTLDDNLATEMDPRMRLMYAGSEGGLDGIKVIIDSGTDVNFSDIDGRTALHVATCQGYADVVEFLLRKGAKVDPKDIWGSTIDPRVRLMYSANEGDLDGIKEIIDSGTDVNFADIDGRTALHVATCQGYADVVGFLLRKGAKVDPKDRWGSTPLADAIHYKNHAVIKLLEKHGAKSLMAPMHVQNSRHVPEYEINSKEIDFTGSTDITKGTYCIASWRGIKVAVKKLAEEVTEDEEKVTAFRDELELLQKIRHPNVVQFLGAVTQNTPMMIVTEYLPKGDLCEYLKEKGPLGVAKALRFALDIARGLSYLHEIRPAAIIHRDLEPSNILRDDSGHLKVADFGVSKLLKLTARVKEDRPLTCQDSSCRYVAPEVFRNEEYDTKVDVFSFALILQEMIEGCPPFSAKHDGEVPKAYALKERPPFRAPTKLYSHGLKELIEDCWSENPAKRPTFRQIIARLDTIYDRISRKKSWTVGTLRCFPKFEAMWKKDNGGLSRSRSRSSRSTRSI